MGIKGLRDKISTAATEFEHEVYRLEADRDAWRELCRELVEADDLLNQEWPGPLWKVITKARARLAEGSR